MIPPHRCPDTPLCQIFVDFPYVLNEQLHVVLSLTPGTNIHRHSPFVMANVDCLWLHNLDIFIKYIKVEAVRLWYIWTIGIRPFCLDNFRKLTVSC